MEILRKITDDILFVGGNDRRISRFENMFALPEGVSYNAYVMRDETSTVLFDGIDSAVAERYYRDVETALDGRDLDYFVVHHVEPDHCTSIQGILLRYPNAKMLISGAGLRFLKQFYNKDFSDRVQVIKDGDTLELETRKLRFIAGTNVHWPEVMMTYDDKTGALFSADAFGSFKTPDGHIFADQVAYERDWLGEARRYYTNIVGKQGPFVQRVFKKIEDAGLDIKMILPLHGLVFRTPEDIAMIIDKYQKWSTYTPEEKGVVIVYGSLYGNTMEAADTLAWLLAERDVPNIRVYDVSETDRSYLVADLFRFSHAVFACPTYNADLFPPMDAFLRDIIGLNLKDRAVSLLENKTWAGKTLQTTQTILEGMPGLRYVGEPVQMLSSLGEEQTPAIEQLADAIKQDIETA